MFFMLQIGHSNEKSSHETYQFISIARDFLQIFFPFDDLLRKMVSRAQYQKQNGSKDQWQK